MTIQETKTAQLVETLKNNGFEAILMNAYANDYNQDYNHLSITVRNSDDKLKELSELTKNFEVVLGRYINEDKPVFLVRKARRFAELIEQDGINYDLLNRRETTPLTNCTVLNNEDWVNFYNETV